MKKFFKKLKIKIKGLLVIKIANLKKQIKIYEQKIIDNVLLEQQYIDKINLLEDDIRQLTLRLSKEERELWLQERNNKNERYTNKKK